MAKDIFDDGKQQSDAGDNRIAALKAQIAAQEKSINALQDSLKAMMDRMSSMQQQPQQLVLQKEPSLSDRSNERSAQQREAERQRLLELLDGPKQWYVSVEGEPRMGRQVGAADEANAEVKYRKHMGIRGITDANKAIRVEPFDASAHDSLIPSEIHDRLAA
jgi:uncharacterized coiled-coil protein SlyX